MALTPGELASLYAAATDPASKQFTFATPGTHTVYGRLVDKDGRLSADYQADVTVVSVSALANVTASAGAAYELNLVAVGATPESWAIDWNDGSDPDGDGLAGQVVPGSVQHVEHVFAKSGPSLTVNVAATVNGTVLATDPLAVAVVDGLVITGPGAAHVGDGVTFQVAGPGDGEAVWSAARPDGSVFATGTGRQFRFAPPADGRWRVEVTSVGSEPSEQVYVAAWTCR
jgi:hypothetical protein